jgi:chemotaxis protein MotB
LPGLKSDSVVYQATSSIKHVLKPQLLAYLFAINYNCNDLKGQTILPFKDNKKTCIVQRVKIIIMQINSLVLIVTCSLVATSCVSSKKYKSLNTNYQGAQADLTKCRTDNSSLTASKQSLESENAGLKKQTDDLAKQVDYLKANNTQALQQLQDMSVISKQQAESIKQSMENIGAKDSYIQTLQQQMAHKDSMNMALMMNLKGAVGDMNDEDINIKVDKGIVIIDISDKMLFKSGSYEVTTGAKDVLGKVAKVLKAQSDISCMVEGHTDNVPYKGNKVLVDNWDLSVKRATSVVRLLQKQHGMEPSKMLAAGRSEYMPLSENDTKEGKAANRRTRIVILPELDQFFKLLEPQKETTSLSKN